MNDNVTKPSPSIECLAKCIYPFANSKEAKLRKWLMQLHKDPTVFSFNAIARYDKADITSSGFNPA